LIITKVINFNSMREFKNKKAEKNFHIIKTFEAGLSLTGNEIKSIRAGKINFIDSYATIKDGEAWLHSLHISHYDKGFYQEYNPRRSRKLLLHKHQIKRLLRKVKEKSYTLIPVRLYINEDGYAKIELALAKGKKKYEKRFKIKKREDQKRMDRYSR